MAKSKKIAKSKHKWGYNASQKLKSLTDTQLQNLQEQSVRIATDRLIVVAAWVAKKVFKDNASNPKMEEFLLEFLSTLEKVGDEKVSLNALSADVEAMCKIKWDENTGDWINLKRKD